LVNPSEIPHLSGRIGAIGRVMLAPVFFDGMDLESLVLDEMLWQAARPERYSINGPEVRLDPRTAELMSLVIHELATNAVKYGALSQPGARIRVAWALALHTACPQLRFSWEESGVMMAAVPLSRGFGRELVERLIARELKGDGRMTFLPDGLHCKIEVPLRDARHRDE
jgi:two-component system, chemotaxis family, CheB/CheR fusion protein